MLITLFYTVLVLGILVVAGIAISKTFGGRGQSYKADYHREMSKRVAAERGLRQIASGNTGNPVLTAQVTLDEIDQITIKEIA